MRKYDILKVINHEQIHKSRMHAFHLQNQRGVSFVWYPSSDYQSSMQKSLSSTNSKWFLMSFEQHSCNLKGERIIQVPRILEPYDAPATLAS